MFQTKAVEKIKTKILKSTNFVFESPGVCEIIWKNSVEPGMPQIEIWCLYIARRVPKATKAHPSYVIFNRFPTATMVTRTDINVTQCAHCLYCFFLHSCFPFHLSLLNINCGGHY